MSACGFEKEVSLALREGRWPAAADAALRQHVAGCSSCSDLVLVTETLQHSRAFTAQAAVLPHPGALYWRAQLRRRSGAVERMSRPIVFAEVATFAATLFALALAAHRWIDFVDWTSLRDRLPYADLHLADALSALPASIPLLSIAALVLFAVGGLAIYVLAHNE
jgi:hypothetical protein